MSRKVVEGFRFEGFGLGYTAFRSEKELAREATRDAKRNRNGPV